MRRPLVEILYFEGCPNHEPARALVQRIAAELRVEPQIDLLKVVDADAATEQRFLGSPTVRVNGRDVEPGADERRGFSYACRVYPGERGLAGQPDPSWIRDALAEAGKWSTVSDDGDRLPPRIAGALAAAEIPPSKLGPARHARLTDSERDLYFWILRSFATSGRPSGAEIREEAGRLGLDIESAFESLAREDLVHLGSDGEIAVAYPFSGRPTSHRVRFPSGNETYSMCAIDALGIAPMFEETIEVTSRDPLTGDEVYVRLAPDGTGEWRPEPAVVVAGAVGSEGASFCCCCPVLNFFASVAHAEHWLEQHADARGEVITMRDAAHAGRAVFGDVLVDV